MSISFACLKITGINSQIEDSDYQPVVMVHTYNSSTGKAEAGRFLPLLPAWSTD